MSKASEWILAATVLAGAWASEARGDATEWGDADDGEFGGGGALQFDAGREGVADEGALEWGDDTTDLRRERGEAVETRMQVPVSSPSQGEPATGGAVEVGSSSPGEVVSPSGNVAPGVTGGLRGYGGTGIAPADADLQDRQKEQAEAAAGESPDVPDRFEPFRRVAPSGEDIWELPGLQEIKPGSKDTAETTTQDGD